MRNKTAWENAAEAQGTTDSERVLAQLTRKTFLSLWSYPNVYSDEGRSGGKGGRQRDCGHRLVHLRPRSSTMP